MKNVKIIKLPKILDSRGNLSFFENSNQIPFDIKRTYWIYDVPGGEKRGGHAFKKSHELIVALSGSFNIVLNDGNEEVTYTLNRSYNGLYVPNLIWRSIDNFSTNSLALIVSNIKYNSQDYIRDFKEFKTLKHEK
ncbi:FdtA/QdtA family cupin domain-containing protein [Flavobacteriaceae bacterium]|nr:FdtA/QdtA family cupin domain-containing protein [Flavobacteriaceae bacterium]